VELLKLAVFFYLSFIVSVVYKMTKEPTAFEGLVAGLRLFVKLVAGLALCAAALLVVEIFI